MRVLLLGLVVIALIIGAVGLIAAGRGNGERTAAPDQSGQGAQHVPPTATTAAQDLSRATEIPLPAQPRAEPTATSTPGRVDFANPIPQDSAAAALFGGEAANW